MYEKITENPRIISSKKALTPEYDRLYPWCWGFCGLWQNCLRRALCVAWTKHCDGFPPRCMGFHEADPLSFQPFRPDRIVGAWRVPYNCYNKTYVSLKHSILNLYFVKILYRLYYYTKIIISTTYRFFLCRRLR